MSLSLIAKNIGESATLKLNEIAAILREAGVPNVELLPYNPMGLSMFEDLGRPKPSLPERFMRADEMEEARRCRARDRRGVRPDRHTRCLRRSGVLGTPGSIEGCWGLGHPGSPGRENARLKHARIENNLLV